MLHCSAQWMSRVPYVNASSLILSQYPSYLTCNVEFKRVSSSPGLCCALATGRASPGNDFGRCCNGAPIPLPPDGGTLENSGRFLPPSNKVTWVTWGTCSGNLLLPSLDWKLVHTANSATRAKQALRSSAHMVTGFHAQARCSILAEEGVTWIFEEGHAEIHPR